MEPTQQNKLIMPDGTLLTVDHQQRRLLPQDTRYSPVDFSALNRSGGYFHFIYEKHRIFKQDSGLPGYALSVPEKLLLQSPIRDQAEIDRINRNSARRKYNFRLLDDVTETRVFKRHLPVIDVGGRYFFVDAYMKELRDTGNFYHRIPLDEGHRVSGKDNYHFYYNFSTNQVVRINPHSEKAPKNVAFLNIPALYTLDAAGLNLRSGGNGLESVFDHPVQRHLESGFIPLTDDNIQLVNSYYRRKDFKNEDELRSLHAARMEKQGVAKPGQLILPSGLYEIDTARRSLINVGNSDNTLNYGAKEPSGGFYLVKAKSNGHLRWSSPLAGFPDTAKIPEAVLRAPSADAIEIERMNQLSARSGWEFRLVDEITAERLNGKLPTILIGDEPFTVYRELQELVSQRDFHRIIDLKNLNYIDNQIFLFYKPETNEQKPFVSWYTKEVPSGFQVLKLPLPAVMDPAAFRDSSLGHLPYWDMIQHPVQKELKGEISRIEDSGILQIINKNRLEAGVAPLKLPNKKQKKKGTHL